MSVVKTAAANIRRGLRAITRPSFSNAVRKFIASSYLSG